MRRGILKKTGPDINSVAIMQTCCESQPLWSDHVSSLLPDGTRVKKYSHPTRAFWAVEGLSPYMTENVMLY
jgi:hypothetical protein